MKKLLILFILLFGSTAYAFNPFVVFSGAPASSGGTTECVGFDGQACDGTNVPDNVYGGGTDITSVYQWTATKDCTASRVRIYFTTSHTWTAAKVVIYNGTTLVGTADITPSDSSWVWSSSLVAESGQSLSILTDDVIRFGISIDAIGAFEIARDDSGSNYYRSTSYLPATVISWDTYEKQMGAQLEYTY